MVCGCGATGITEYNYNGAWGYYDDAAAEQLLSFVNAERNSAQTTVLDDWGNVIEITNVASLNKNNDLYTKAKNRATQAAVSFDHNGEEHECLAWGYGNAQAAYEAWCYSADRYPDKLV